MVGGDLLQRPVRSGQRAGGEREPRDEGDALFADDVQQRFTAIVEQDGPWFISYCAEVPGANGQGKTREECLSRLREAISLILESRREESFRALPPEAQRELVVVG